nr:histone-lysine N-methyltransferase setd3 [Onthophagus taurus]
MGKKAHTRHVPKQQTKHRAAHNLTFANELETQIDILLKLTTQTPNANVNKEFEAVKEIYAVLDKIRILENNIDSKYFRDDRSRLDVAILERFGTWLKEFGAKFEGTAIKEFDGYDLGLKAEVDIPVESLIIAVPRKLMLTVEAAKKSGLGHLIENDKIMQNMPNVALTIYLLFEKFSPDSFWEPYFNILPQNYSTVLYFNLEDLELLTGSPTFKSVLNQIKHISRQYAYFHKMISTAQDSACEVLRKRFTFKEYCWAVSTIMTRQNTIPSEDGKERVNALIPLWDMCNHTNGSISTDYNPELDRCECLAIKNFKAGDQLFIFYGPRTNADLFVHNGFVYEENEFDFYPLTLGVSQSDVLRDKRLEILGKLNIDLSVPFKLTKNSPPIDGDLLAFLRIFNMNEEQLNHWLSGDRCNDLTYSECALETVLEKKTWMFLQMRMKLLLSSYKTTLDEDLGMISNKNSCNKNLIIRLKVTEKRILYCVLEYAEQCLKQFI